MENNKITITDNVKKLFAKPLPSTRSGAFYNTFPYPTKISPETIAVYIAASTEPGDTVLDTFSGSGSTGIACIHNNRSYIGYELEKEYFKISERRFLELMKKKENELFS